MKICVRFYSIKSFNLKKIRIFQNIIQIIIILGHYLQYLSFFTSIRFTFSIYYAIFRIYINLLSYFGYELLRIRNRIRIIFKLTHADTIILFICS